MGNLLRSKLGTADSTLVFDTLVQGFRTLGLEPDMGLMVHSSLRSFGHVEGGAATVIDALMEVLTPSGTLLLPSFNHGAPFEADGPGVYDPQKTPTINVAIPDPALTGFAVNSTKT